MTLQTNPADRREMVRAISERLGSPAVYLRMPTCAYRIGGLTVESDGSIASDDEALLETLRPMLIERGWLTDAVDSEAEAPPAETELSFPVEDWAVPQLNNLIRVLYGNQHILRRMMRSDEMCIRDRAHSRPWAQRCRRRRCSRWWTPGARPIRISCGSGTRWAMPPRR